MADERFVTLAEVEELLMEESKLRELSSEQKLALDHATRLKKLPADKAKAMQKELEQIDFVSPAIACKLVDILPTHPDDIRILFTKERLVLEKKHIDQILKVVEKYL
ncbi:MAG: RNA polymerase Rpb4 family protein [Methanomassiliicoccales archaeon]|jgi:DNA-directed RNA polymerase subunit F|nr:RNA polymerase Rpb4 family protein [Methanomassiliicoccales archaeon]